MPTEQASASCPPLIAHHDNNVFISTDFIYWTAKQEGNTYAATGAAITVPGTVDPNTSLTATAVSSTGRVYAPHSKLKPGFKALLGVHLGFDSWDVFAEYTWLYSKAQGSVHTNTLNTGILPLFAYTPHNSSLANTTYSANAGATGFISSASSTWQLHFNNLNLELGKSLPFSCHMMLYPHFGLQVSWQKQHFRSTYQVNSFTTPTTSLGNNRVYFDQKFWGFGPRVGLYGLWKFSKYVGLFVDSAVALLWGQFKATASSYDTNTVAGYTDVLIAEQLYSPHSLSPVLELSPGFVADFWFCANKYRCVAKAAWETQVWFLQNQHASTIADTSLLLQGLTLSLGFDF